MRSSASALISPPADTADSSDLCVSGKRSCAPPIEVSGSTVLPHDDDADLARPVHTAYQYLLDIGGAAGAPDLHHRTRLIRPAREQRAEIIQAPANPSPPGATPVPPLEQ